MIPYKLYPLAVGNNFEIFLPMSVGHLNQSHFLIDNGHIEMNIRIL